MVYKDRSVPRSSEVIKHHDFKNLGTSASPEQKHIFKFRPVLKAHCFAMVQCLNEKSEKELKCIYIYLDSYELISAAFLLKLL